MIEARLTPEQVQRTKEILEDDPGNAKFKILANVLGDMGAPEGVERTYDEWGRVQLYDGFRAQSLVARLTEEYS